MAADARTLDADGWPYPVIEFLLGSRTPDATLAAAPNSDARAEVYCYIGQWYLLKNNRAEADAALAQATRTCPANFHEYIGAIAELRRFSPPVKS